MGPVSPELFAALVDERNWTVQRAFEYARTHPRDEFFALLAPELAEESIPAALETLLGVPVSPWEIAISPQRVGAAVALLRRLRWERRAGFLAEILERVKRIERDPERAIALALLLEFLEGDTHTAAISEVFDRALNGPSFLFLYQQLLPVLAAQCRTDAKDFQKVVDRAVLQAFSSIGAETFEVLEENFPVFRKIGYAPEELSLLKDIAPWLGETKWRRVFSAAESLVESNEDPKKMVSFLEAALSHPLTAERARLIARMETLLDGELDPHLRFELLKIAYQVAEERKGQYAEQLVELSLEMGTASSAKEALKLCSAHLESDWRGFTASTKRESGLCDTPFFSSSPKCDHPAISLAEAPVTRAFTKPQEVSSAISEYRSYIL